MELGMIKEELEKEADKWLVDNLHSTEEDYKRAYLAGAEPREKRIAELEATCNKWFEHLKNREEELLNELNNQNAKYNKQIAELSKHIVELQEDKGELTDKVKELEAQNEEIENYFVESAGYGRDKVRNFMDIVNKALQQKGERIAELERENVKLQGLVSQYKSSKCSGISLANRNMIMSDQLVKAKEIIKEFVEWANWQSNSECPSFKSIQHKAEQFLSEVRK
jgi:cell division septum initiation protein DivIVA